MSYELILLPEVEQQMMEWRRSGQKKILAKIVALLDELTIHPKTGTGKVEQLKGRLAGLWSRRIVKKNRLVYSINDDKIIVVVISLRGHYEDK